MKTLLFWSGGKDSLLARHYLDLSSDEVILLTTYDEEEAIVPHQQIPLKVIQRQAVAFGHMSTVVPLPDPCPNTIYLERVVAAISALPWQINTLVFGDWKNREIRTWREKVLEKRGFNLRFPIWDRPIDELLTTLQQLPGRIVIQAVQPEWNDSIEISAEYNREFVRQLPEGVDPMGENGEFHTCVVPGQ